MPDPLALLANAAGKLTRLGLQLSGRGGTALPGLVALTIDPDFIAAVAVGKLDPRVTLVLNADDPIVAWLGQRHGGPVVYFGVDDPAVGGLVPQAISDATRCPRCRQPLRYERVVLAHEGDWSCPSCGLARPERDVYATRVVLTSMSSEIQLRAAVACDF